MRLSLLKAATLAVAALVSSAVSAADVTVNPAGTWLGFMNVSNLPADGGAYAFGSGWGFADLNASFAGPVLTLTPNTSIARDVPFTDAFWWKPDTTGNKSMEANGYIEDNTGALSGTTVNFSGTVLANTLVAPYSVVAFIKDFDPGYGLTASSVVPLTAAGDFTLSLPTIPGAGRHIQYGFALTGPNARLTDQFGSIQITASVPEPASLGFITLGGLTLIRRRKA